KVSFFTQVVNGDKVWRKMLDGDAEEIKDKDKIAEVKEDRYVEQVRSLLPLIKDKEFKFEPLGEVKVEDKPAVGVLVKHKGHKDVNLYFDKKSGLLVKVEQTVKDEATDKDIMQETILSDYKEIGGVKHSMKMVVNREGKKYLDGTMS